MPKAESNVEIVERLMTFGNPMKQLFIVEAIADHAQRIAETPVEDLRKAFGPNSFISPDSWHHAATEIHREMQAKYGPRRED